MSPSAPDLAAAAEAIGRLLQAVETGEFVASAESKARLEGAYLALRALADGQSPDRGELYGLGLHESDI